MKLTQRQLAAAVSEHGSPIDASGLSRIEAGERAPRLRELVAISDALDVDVSILMGATNAGTANLTAEMWLDRVRRAVGQQHDARLQLIALARFVVQVREEASLLQREMPDDEDGAPSTAAKRGTAYAQLDEALTTDFGGALNRYIEAYEREDGAEPKPGDVVIGADGEPALFVDYLPSVDQEAPVGKRQEAP